MADVSDDQLGSMGLSIRPANLDANPDFNDWAKRAEYHDKVKGNTSQPEMPKSEVMWRKELGVNDMSGVCLLYTSPSPRDRSLSRMPSSA